MVRGRGESPKKLIGFLEWQDVLRGDPDLAEEPYELSSEEQIALQIWNMLGGCDWSGFELACAFHGVRDLHAMALMLAAIRDGQAEMSERNRRT